MKKQPGHQWLIWYRSGSPWVWLNAGAVTLCMVMVIGLILVICVRGFGHFWTPTLIEAVYHHADGSRERVLGRILAEETMAESGAETEPQAKAEHQRLLLGMANRDLNQEVYRWLWKSRLQTWQKPQQAVIVERITWGDFYGYPVAIFEDDKKIADADTAIFFEELSARVQRSQALRKQLTGLDKRQIAPLNQALEKLRMQQIRAERAGDTAGAATFVTQQSVLRQEFEPLNEQRAALLLDLSRDRLQLRAANGEQIETGFDRIVRISWPNRMSLHERITDYVKKLFLFLSEPPREANTAGGIYPALFGTLAMVMIMSVIVTPFGVLAAIFLHEYARQGWFVRLVRISVYNLAGVPSIVYGIFGLGFFVYIVGGGIDQIFYEDSLPAPVFGTPGLFWASLTMALLTLPVVIVSTEEGLSRIPVSLRHGSFALGATRSETIWKVVVPLAMPAMLTGLILAVARAAGEVAPLMLVGVVKLAPALPVDGTFPYVHLDRKIMHLGYHIYDTGFRSANIEAVRSLVYASSLVLLLLIVVMNMTAISIRNNLRRKYRTALE